MDDYDDCDNSMANYIQAVVMSFVDVALLEEVTARVNAKLKYKTDDVNHLQRAVESRQLGTGDCEDYAILKAQELKDAGVDPTLMTLALCHTRKSKQLHAVLLVASRKRVGWLSKKWADCTRVLDNMNDYAYRLENTGITIEKQFPVAGWLT